MKRVKLSKNFYLDEYIPEYMYKAYINKPHYLIGLLDPRLINVDQFLRDRFGSATINNWIGGGNREWSGIRTLESRYYSKLSQHSYGRASDKIFSNASAEEVRQDIKQNYTELYEPLGLSCIEDDVSWLHSDVRFHNFGGLLIVNP